MVLGDVQVVADQLEDEDSFALVLVPESKLLGALLKQVFQHIGRSASTIGRPRALDRLDIHGQTLELGLMAVSSLMVPCASALLAGVGECAKRFEELLYVTPRSQHHDNVDVACGKLEAVAVGTKRVAALDDARGDAGRRRLADTQTHDVRELLFT